MTVIGLDLMGGDTPAPKLFSAITKLLDGRRCPFSLALFGTPAYIKKFSTPRSCDVEMVSVNDYIALDEDPIKSVRSKKNCSTNVGMQLLRSKDIDAFLSIGNTGALLCSSKIHIGTLKTISRPALLAHLPTKGKLMSVLDVGANVTSKPEHLVQFAKMGIAYQKTLGRKNPKVGLLNNGCEKQKGRKEHIDAYKKLKRSLRSHFIGNIEGCDVFDGKVDVLVTDGFTGNIFLKTSEGLSRFIFSKTKCPQELNPDNYPGAILCGIKEIVIKCHSYASPEAIVQGLFGAYELINKNFIHKLKTSLS